MKNRIVSAGGIVHCNGHVLLIRSPNREYFTWPKGRVEKGESLEDAALREVEEETGIEVEIEFFSLSWKGKHKTVHYYMMKPCGTSHKLPDPKEIKNVRWIFVGSAYRYLKGMRDLAVLYTVMDFLSPYNK